MMNRKVLGLPLPFAVLGGVVLLVLLLIILNIGSIIGGVADGFTFLFDPGSREMNIIPCGESNTCQIVHPIVYSVLLLAVVITGFAYTTLLERKMIAYFQQRSGPNRVGPGGFLQPAADGLKLIFKEDIMPSLAYRNIYLIAPMLKAIPTLVVLAVIPLGPPINIPWFDGNWYHVPLGLIDTNVAVLWLLAITSLGTYGVVLAGWASNNKYSMLGGMRASAQMVSYEISMGLALAVPVMIVGSMSLRDIVEAQDGFFVNWLVFQNPLAAFILLVALVAETNRAPFDLPEAEQELTAGYMTEYSGMKFALFMMAEYLGMIAVSFIAAVMFFGGYNDGFGLVENIPILGPLVIIGKVVLFLMAFVWLRATLPRIRYDRLMMFGWKIMLPLALLAVVWTAVAVVVSVEWGEFAYFVVSTGMAIVVALGSLLFIGVPRDQQTEDEGEYETDPMITGEQNGIGYSILQFVGALVSIPFVLYEFTLTQLDNLSQLAPDEEDDEDAYEGDSTTRLPSETGGD